MKAVKSKKVKGSSDKQIFTIYLLLSPCLFLCFYGVFVVDSSAQTGGIYEIKQSVIASGGASSGGTYSLENVTEQAIAGGFVQGSQYSIYNGFLFPSLAPTAANVSISGRVMTFYGQGVRNARVILNAPSGEMRISVTGSFGYYQFAEIPVGETYIFTVSSKRFVFANPTRVITVSDEVTELNFTAEP